MKQRPPALIQFGTTNPLFQQTIAALGWSAGHEVAEASTATLS